jgi:hypothetical protein
MTGIAATFSPHPEDEDGFLREKGTHFQYLAVPRLRRSFVGNLLVFEIAKTAYNRPPLL